jgi:cytochrome bd ubiquinol oxidase subunit II
VLRIGFFLAGFDFGVGLLMPFLGKNDVERRAIINTVLVIQRSVLDTATNQ